MKKSPASLLRLQMAPSKLKAVFYTDYFSSYKNFIASIDSLSFAMILF